MLIVSNFISKKYILKKWKYIEIILHLM